MPMYQDMFRQCLDMPKQCLVIVIAMVLLMAPLHSLNHNNENQVKHDFFSNVMLLVSVLLSCDANCIMIGIIVFIR